MTGRLYVLLAPLVDGLHTVAAIVEKLEGQVAAADVYYALTRLESKGYITEGDATLTSNIAAFWSILGLGAVAARDRMEGTSVCLQRHGSGCVVWW